VQDEVKQEESEQDIDGKKTGADTNHRYDAYLKRAFGDL